VFRKLPFHIWFAGLFIVIASLYLIYHLALGQYGVLFKGYREGYWWQYIIAVLLCIFGVVFMYAGKIEQINLDKEVGILSRSKMSIFCQKETTEWALDQIINVRVFKRGHDGVQVMTIQYEVQVDFIDAPCQTILKSQSKDKAIAQMAKIKVFLGLVMHKSDLKFIDESTSKYKGRSQVYEDE